MLKLHAVQAGHGDCLVLEFGTDANPKFILIDGAPPEHYNDLEKAISQIIGTGKKVEKLVLSHVDMDHLGGLLNLFSTLRLQRENGDSEILEIKDFWINEFSSVFGNDLEAQMMQVLTASPETVNTMGEGSLVFNGIPEGHKLQADALVLGIPINNNIAERYISVEHISNPISLSNITMTVVGPTKENLEELRKKWEGWLEEHKEDLEMGDIAEATMADRSIPNLSSIILLIEGDNKTFLLTGDCRGDHLLQGLKKRGLLDEDGKFHVNVFKAQHHGSDRSTTKKFFKTVTADTYVFSADGKNGNPDYKTLKWLIEAAIEDNRRIRIFLTNETDSTALIQNEMPPNQNGYSMKFISENKVYLTVEN